MVRTCFQTVSEELNLAAKSGVAKNISVEQCKTVTEGCFTIIKCLKK